MIPHKIDPSTIQVGQEVRYECPVDGCSNAFWRRWLVGCASGKAFGDPSCYMHGTERAYLVITDIREPGEDSPPGPDSTYVLSGIAKEEEPETEQLTII